MPPIHVTPEEIEQLRRYALTEETTGLLSAALDELLYLRQVVSAMTSAAEALLVETKRRW